MPTLFHMKKEFILACALAACTIGSAHGVATNYALTLEPAGSVDCGQVAALDGAASYTLQLWLCPDVWATGTPVVGADGWQLALGNPGELTMRVATGTVTVSDPALEAGQWSHLTLICDNGTVTALVNGGVTKNLGTLPALPANGGALTIGGGFDGRIDDLRLWSAPLKADYDYFVMNTLNRWTPQLGDLAAYYKFDQTDCPQIVEQTAVWSGDNGTVNNHGVASATGVTKTAVTDNPAMAYRINGAYTANERFYDRGIEADQYLLSNDLIILGIESYPDGHLRYTTPCNHGTLAGTAKVTEADGRGGVLALDGEGWMDCGTDLFNLADEVWMLELFFNIDTWTEGATLLAKETADGQHGLSVRLGKEDRHELVVHVDGHQYGLINKLSVGKWHHLAIWPGANVQLARFTLNFCLDGKEAQGSSSLASTEICQVPTGNADCAMEVGRGLKGQIDELAFWTYRGFSTGQIAGHMNNGCPMPGYGVVLTADVMKNAQAYYKFDNAANPGYDSYSQDSWRDIMTDVYKGTSGAETRISVKSHNNWQNTIADAGRRKIFAEDLARLSEGYDGVELDLEWMYGTQTDLGLLAEEIRKALPVGKSFNISCHNVAYMFPKDKMEYVDGFTFQQYGPQNMHFQLSQFKDMCQTFVNYGFPKDKIITSYSTTTSRGYKGGTPYSDISGVRNDFLGDHYTPADDRDEETRGELTYYFVGPHQVYKRARHTVENGFGGIFYWDMGNDVPVAHKYNMAKWCSYALNSNVEPRVTAVTVSHASGVDDITAEARGAMQVSNDGNTLTVNGISAASVQVFDLAGRRVAAAAGNSAEISALRPGVYLVSAADERGTRHSAKFAK